MLLHDEDLLLYSVPEIYTEYEDGLIVCRNKDGSIAAWYGGETGPTPEDAEAMGIDAIPMYRYIDPDEPANASVWLAFYTEAKDPLRSLDDRELSGEVYLDLSGW